MSDFASSSPFRFLPRRASGSSAGRRRRSRAWPTFGSFRRRTCTSRWSSWASGLVPSWRRSTPSCGPPRQRPLRRCSSALRYRETRSRGDGRVRRRGRRRGAAPGGSLGPARPDRGLPSRAKDVDAARHRRAFPPAAAASARPAGARPGQSVRRGFLHFKTAPNRSAVRDPGNCPVRRVNTWTASRHLKPR